MGKLFRYGMAGAVLATAGFYLATVQVMRHPDSFFARSGRTVFHLGTHSNVVFQIGQAVIREAGRVVLKASPRPELESEDPTLCPPGEPQPIDEPVPGVQEELPPLFHDRPEKGGFYYSSMGFLDNQAIQAVREQLPPIPFQGAEEPPLADDSKAAATPDVISQPAPEPQALSRQPSSAPESDQPQKKMPRWFDDDKDVPPRMPRAEGAEAPANIDDLFRFWMGEGRAQYQQLLDPPNIDDLLRFWMELFQESTKETGSQEESEALDEEVPPPCQEDPVYHHQYPGCPFTGKCPFLDPPALRSAPSLREHKEKNRSKNLDFDPLDFGPDGLSVPERLKRLLPQAGSEQEELLPPPNVDTTEFRPSDAKPGEFDPQPM